jgi:hypothetical protein
MGQETMQWPAIVHEAMAYLAVRLEEAGGPVAMELKVRFRLLAACFQSQVRPVTDIPAICEFRDTS